MLQKGVEKLLVEAQLRQIVGHRESLGEIVVDMFRHVELEIAEGVIDQRVEERTGALDSLPVALGLLAVERQSVGFGLEAANQFVHIGFWELLQKFQQVLKSALDQR